MEEDLSHLETEQSNDRSTNLDSLSTLELATLINDEDAKVALAVQKELPTIAAAIDAIAEKLSKNGRMIYIGCGTSGRLAVIDASELPVTFSAPDSQVIAIIAGGKEAIWKSKEGVEDSATQPVTDLQNAKLTNLDVLVGLTASGRTPYVLAAVEYAKSLGCVTIGISCNLNSSLSKIVQYPITPIVGPEVLTGSTRMKAGTAQKMVLNMLSTGVMVKLGKCYRNLMVDVRADACEKLRERAKRILGELCKCDQETAVKTLESCNYNLKTAVLMLIGKIDFENANQLLEKENGHLSGAIDILRTM